MKMRFLIIPLLLVIGCSGPYGVAAKVAQDVAVSVNQAAITVDQLRMQGAISVDEEKKILGYDASINTLDGQYVGCVQAAHNQTVAGGFTKCAQTLLAGMGDPTTLAALHVSNPQSQAKVIAIVSGIEAIVNTAIAALGGN